MAACLLCRHHRRVAHVFEKAVNHRERCAQFMRYIGNKIAARGVGPFNLGNVKTHQQLAPVAERNGFERKQLAGVMGRAVIKGFFRRRALQKRRQSRYPHDVSEAQSIVTPRLQTQMRRCRIVAPQQLIAAIEHGYAVGQRLRSLREELKLFIHCVVFTRFIAQCTIDAREYLPPGAPGVRQIFHLGRLQPALQARKLVHMHCMQQRQSQTRDRPARCGAQPQAHRHGNKPDKQEFQRQGKPNRHHDANRVVVVAKRDFTASLAARHVHCGVACALA